MGDGTRHTAFRAAAVAALFAASLASAQPAKDESDCRPDEVDLGDYCASIAPPDPNGKDPRSRVTPFRAQSMMPGHSTPPRQLVPEPPPMAPEAVSSAEQSGLMPGRVAGAAPEGPAPPTPAVEAPPESEAPEATQAGVTADGFGVQFGVFSARTTAEKVGRTLSERGFEVWLATIPRGERVLWGCIQGPHASRAAAVAAANRLRREGLVADTYVRPLDGLELKVLEHEPTEE